MSGSFGLVELALVFALVLGLALYELRSVRRAAREAGDGKTRHGNEPRDPPA